MDAKIDISEKLTITNTTYSTTPSYSLQVPFDKYLLVSQIALGFDGNMLANGKIQIKVNGSATTSSGVSGGEVGVIANLTIDFKEKDFIVVEPQSSIDINMRVTGGTATSQVMVTGTLLTRDEYIKLKNKFFGGVV